MDDALAGKASGVSVVKADGLPVEQYVSVFEVGASLLGNEWSAIRDRRIRWSPNNYITESDIVNPIESNNYGEDFNNSVQGAFLRGLNNLSGLNIADIESISTSQKDASATAIYGSKALMEWFYHELKKDATKVAQLNLNYYIDFPPPNKEKVLNAEQYKSTLRTAQTYRVPVKKKQGLNLLTGEVTMETSAS